VRILSSGTLIAQPFAAHLAAEMGAQTIHIEHPSGTGDAWRTFGLCLTGKEGQPVATSFLSDRRNSFYITLDLSKKEAREIFLGLIENSDIFMESSKLGAYARWGFDDQTLLKANPRLVITHVSGYGQHGHPDYAGRAAYDAIGQAFGGFMHLQGFPDPEPPVRGNPWAGDYINATNALWSSLAAYIYAQRTGKGQSIDIAGFECFHRFISGAMIEWYELGVIRQRPGNKATAFQPYDCFRAQDGWVMMGAIGLFVFGRVCEVIGLDPKDEKWQKAHTDINSPDGVEFDAIIRGWIGERTVKEVVEAFNANAVPCAAVMDSKMAAEDPHYQARQVHIEWEDVQLGRKVKGTGLAPKFSLTPGKIWRGSVPVGYDNELVYGKLLGLGEEELETLRNKGVI